MNDAGVPANGTPDPRLERVARVVVEMRGNEVGVQANCRAPLAINMMKDAIVVMAQAMVRKENETLIKPAGPVPPPALRRIP